MGNPTYGGLQRLQKYFEGTRFPLVEFRVDIHAEAVLYTCGLPTWKPIFSKGNEEDLSSLAMRAPRMEVRDVALCCLKDGYGIRFVTEYFRDTCTLNEGYEPNRLVFMDAYGHPDFVGYVQSHEDELCTMARYGNISPTFIDRVKLQFFPGLYVFPSME